MDASDIDHNQLLRNLMKNHTDSVYFKDLESRFILVNEACAQKHGWDSVECCIGKTDAEIFSKKHADQAYADEQKIIRTGETFHVAEEKELWHDGSITWASTTKMPLRSPTGKMIGTFGITRDITRRKKADLRVRKYAEQIRGIKEEMEYDIRMAGQLQKSFFSASYPEFPEETPPEAQCIEFLHRFILHQQISGDYCAIQRISEHEAGVLICDVQGGGIRSALGTALIRGVAQEIRSLAGDPSAYLSRMNSLLFPLLKQDGKILYTTACYLTINVRTGGIRMANANHPLPIHFSDAGAQWIGHESVQGPSLGVQAMVKYPIHEATLAPSDAVVLFTNGLFSLKNNLDDAYGLKRLLDSSHSFSNEPIHEIFQGLEDDARAFSRAQRFDDDVCMVGFHLKQLLD
ncbi:MAG: SpoIIE family protein phosphatase [Pontiella sp.]